jgi:hypothetical protein
MAACMQLVHAYIHTVTQERSDSVCRHRQRGLIVHAGHQDNGSHRGQNLRGGIRP